MRNIDYKLALLIPVLAMLILLFTGILGFVMRLSQANILTIDPSLFYTILTFHGLVNVTIFFLAPFTMARYLLSRYIELSRMASIVSWGLIVTGLIGVATSILLGGLAFGWYFLYPIEFYGPWPRWATLLWLISMILIGLGALIIAIDNIRGMVSRYGLSRSLGWHYISGSIDVEVQPIIVISMASSIICVSALISGAELLINMTLEYLGIIDGLDPLYAKNETFMFGHSLANLAMLYALASVYEVMPRYSGKPWKTSWMVAVAWNIAVIYVILAMFHHLFQDYAQPLFRHLLGNIFSWVAPIPAIAVTILGAYSQIYSHRVNRGEWDMVPAYILAGLTSFIIGGWAAVIDATPPANARFHNTLWVPGHFHTYFSYGVVVMSIALLWHLYWEHGVGSLKRGQWIKIIYLMSIGWALHVLSFYLGGLFSIPRRYMVYSFLPGGATVMGANLAIISIMGIIIYSIGYIPLLYYSIRSLIGLVGRRW